VCPRRAPIPRLRWRSAKVQSAALVIGAGFSKWAADLPVASQLFDFNVSPRTQRERQRVAVLQRDFDAWRAANPSEPTEAFVQWSLAKSTMRARRVTWYVARRLSDPFLTRISGGTSALMIDERRVRAHQGVLKAGGFLRGLVPWRL